MKILKTEWFSTLKGEIGVVLIENEIGQQSARIAPVSGISEMSDSQTVADFGAKLSEKQAAGFFDDLKNYKQ